MSVKSLLLYAIFVLGLSVYAWVAWQALGITYDSKAYLQASQSLCLAGEFRTQYGYYTNWLPLFPILLYFTKPFWIQGFAFLLNILLIYLIASKVFLGLGMRFFVVSLCVFSAPIYLVHVFVWSEAWFLVFLMPFFLFLDRTLQNSKNLIYLCLIANLLCLQRIAGIFFVLPAFLLLVYYYPKKWFQIGVCGLLSISGLILWLVRNSFLQPRANLTDNILVVSFQESILERIHLLVSWFAPVYGLSEIIVVLLSFIVVFIMVWQVWKGSKIVGTMAFLCLTYFFIVLFLCLSLEGERFLIPIFPFIVFVFSDFCASFFQKYKHLYLKWCLYGYDCMWFLYGIARFLKNILSWSQVLQS